MVNQLAQVLLDLVQSFWLSFLDVIPSLVGAIVLLAIGYILGRILGRVANEIVTRLKLDKRVQTGAHLRLKISKLSDIIVRWVIYLVFIQQAAQVLGSSAVSGFVGEVVRVLPEFIGAGILILVSYAVGIYFKDHIISSHTPYSDLAGKTVFFLILYLGLSVALRAINIPLLIVDQVLVILVASLGLGLALALGLGLKDVIRDVSKSYAKKHKGRK